MNFPPTHSRKTFLTRLYLTEISKFLFISTKHLHMVRTKTLIRPTIIISKRVGIKTSDERAMGFTLLELMIVITIISILAAGTGFALARKMPDYHLQQAANDLFLDFQLAKSTAVLHQEIVQVDFSGETSRYRITRLGSDGKEGGEGPAADVTVKQVNLSTYRDGVAFGRGSVPPYPGCSDEVISYPEKRTQFMINGSVNANGYVYLTHMNKNSCYRVGTPTMAGVVNMDRALRGAWEIQ